MVLDQKFQGRIGIPILRGLKPFCIDEEFDEEIVGLAREVGREIDGAKNVKKEVRRFNSRGRGFMRAVRYKGRTFFTMDFMMVRQRDIDEKTVRTFNSYLALKKGGYENASR